MSKTKNQKNRITKWIAGLLLFVMVFTMLTPVNTVKAAKKQTMYVGEKFEYYITGSTITSASSSNKKVVKASKNKDRRFSCNLEAKKAGSATITVKYKDYYGKFHTHKLKVTVKKLDIDVSLQPLESGSGYVLLKVKNNTGQTFDHVNVKCTIKNPSGEIVQDTVERVVDVISKKTAYYSLRVGKDVTVDYQQSSAKTVDGSRDPQYTYKNVSSKDVVVTEMDTIEEGNFIRFKLKRQNKLNKDIKVVNYILSYNAQGQIIDSERYIAYLGKKETKTSSECSVSRSPYIYPDFDHYEIVTQAYTSERKK